MNTQPKEINISCPHCGQHLAIDESMLDIELECPTCKQTFTASRPTAKVARISVWRRAKELFLRLPERAQGAVMASAAFLVGIALFARFISTDNHDDVMRSYGKEDDKKTEKTSSHPTSYSAPPNSTQRENASQDVPRKPIGEERAQEETNSLYQEAMRYYNGDGVLQNYDKAVQLLFDASSKGSKDADAELAGIFWNGKANQQSNQELAVKYALKHGDLRKTDASMVLGLSYLFGYETKNGKVAPDFQKAYQQFAAAGHHQQAVFFKGLMEYHGVGTAKSAQKAAETFYECCKGKRGPFRWGMRPCVWDIFITRARASQKTMTRPKHGCHGDGNMDTPPKLPL